MVPALVFGRHLHAPIGDMPQLARDDTLLSPAYRQASSSKACIVAGTANAALRAAFDF